jgi:sugar phosphate isomerase/epimerase
VTEEIRAKVCEQKEVLTAMYSRRDFGRLALSGAALSTLQVFEVLAAARDAAVIESTVRGVKLGIITGGFGGGGGRGGAAALPAGSGAPGGASTSPASGGAPARSNGLPAPGEPDPADVIIESLLAIGAANIELSANLYGAPPVTGGAVGGQAPAVVSSEYTQSREALRQWRLTNPLDRFRQVRGKFEAAGLNLFSHVVTIADDFTDAEIDAVFKQMPALGVTIFCTNQTRVGMGPRIKPFAEKYKIRPAFHTHALVEDPNEVASPASLQKLLDMSPQFMVNLDIGHFTAGNQDAVAYLRAHHDRITHLHVKDRKRNNGPSVTWGTGDTPIAECLRAIRDNKWPIYCIIERDNRDETGSAIELTRKYMDYMKRVLES